MNPQDRLQPSLLDRLIEEAPAGDNMVLSKQQLRQAVMRDLAWLLNAVTSLTLEEAAQPQLANSVLNYGLPPTAGQLASRIDVNLLERQIHDAIVRFEPRILADSLLVTAREFDDVLATHNVVAFEIRGFLWAQPVPLELLLRTQIDLEAGLVEVTDSAGTVRSQSR